MKRISKSTVQAKAKLPDVSVPVDVEVHAGLGGGDESPPGSQKKNDPNGGGRCLLAIIIAILATALLVGGVMAFYYKDHQSPDAVKVKIDALETRVTGLTGEKNILSNDLGKSSAEVSKLKAEKALLEGEKKQVETEKGLLKGELAKLSDELKKCKEPAKVKKLTAVVKRNKIVASVRGGVHSGASDMPRNIWGAQHHLATPENPRPCFFASGNGVGAPPSCSSFTIESPRPGEDKATWTKRVLGLSASSRYESKGLYTKQ